MRTAYLLAAAVLTTLLCPCGCLVNPRPADPPPEKDQLTWLPPETLAAALDNMKTALEAKVLINYGYSFSENSLELLVDPADDAELGENPFLSWSAAQEEQRMSGILAATDASLAVEWTIRDSTDEPDGSRCYRDLGYLLRFGIPGASVEYSGNVNLWFEDNGTGQWFITRWVDKRDDSGRRTWCWLRAANRVEF